MATRRTGYVFEELYMWHDPGSISFNQWVEPGEPWENVATKRRIHGLLSVSGVLEKLTPIKARAATKDEIIRFHTSSYHDRIVHQSLHSKGGDGGELARFAQGGYEIAALSAGGVLAAVESVWRGEVDNAYCLVRPPGHHAVADKGMGFCIFNNIALAAMHVRAALVPADQKVRIAIVDYDVHHGNGTQDAFWNDPDTLFISLHQDNNYPQGEGAISQIGGEGAAHANINIPLPPGSGIGAYEYSFDTVVVPALRTFRPDIILVSSGFDASFMDPLASMMLSSEAYGTMATKLLSIADEFCAGKIVFAHEGGYSKDYVPFCALAVIETLTGFKSSVVDPSLEEVKQWGYQSLQLHQKAAIDAAASIHGLLPTGATSATQELANLSELSPVDQELALAILRLFVGVPEDRKQAILKAIQ